MRIIGYKTNPVEICDSEGLSMPLKDIFGVFNLLLEEYDDSMLKVCWDLDATLAPLLKLLGENNCRTLYTTKKLNLPPVSLFYIPGKVFCVNRGRTQSNLYGIEQYFRGIEEPEEIEGVYALGRYLWEELKAMGMRPTKLTSPAAIYEQCVLRFANKPGVKDIPDELGEFAWRCSSKVWVEAHQLGYWDKTWDYDIVSAFPSVVANLIDTRHCDIVHSKAYQKNAVYGFCKGVVTINPDVKVSPIIRVADNGSSSSRTGQWEDFITKDEIEFIDKWGIGGFDIQDGYWLMPNKITYPMRILTNRLLQYKEKDGLQRIVAKGMSVGGLYGKFGEDRGTEFGQHFNPVWFAQISTEIRLKVAELIYSKKLQDSLIHVSVDGFRLDSPADIESSNRAGDWRLSDTRRALVLSSGLMYTETTTPKGMTLDDILGMVKEHPLQDYYEKTIPGRVTLGEALKSGRFNELGSMVEKYSSIDLYRQNHDREFKELPQTGGQLLSRHYKSIPMSEGFSLKVVDGVI